MYKEGVGIASDISQVAKNFIKILLIFYTLLCFTYYFLLFTVYYILLCYVRMLYCYTPLFNTCPDFILYSYKFAARFSLVAIIPTYRQ